MERMALQTPVLSGAGMVTEWLSRSLFEDSARTGGPRIRYCAFREQCDALHALVNVLSIAESYRSADKGHVRSLEEILAGSIAGGLQFTAPETTSPGARQSLKERADGAARLLLADEGLAGYVAGAFISRELFTGTEKENLAGALGVLKDKVSIAKLIAKERRI